MSLVTLAGLDRTSDGTGSKVTHLSKWSKNEHEGLKCIPPAGVDNLLGCLGWRAQIGDFCLECLGEEYEKKYISWATITKYHRLSGLNSRNLFFHSPRGCKSENRVWGRLFLLRSCRRPSSPSVFTWSLHVCVLISFSYKEIRYTGLGATLMTSLSFNYFFKGSVSKYRHILRH